MKTTDLMAGDWVKTPDGNGIIRLINAIDERFVVCVKGMDCWFLPDVVEPIPLTGEILEKNKFKNYRLSYDDGDYYYHIKLENVVGGIWAEVVSSRNVLHGRKEFSGLINYVHELQHALRLFGIKKNIEL